MISFNINSSQIIIRDHLCFSIFNMYLNVLPQFFIKEFLQFLVSLSIDELFNFVEILLGLNIILNFEFMFRALLTMETFFTFAHFVDHIMDSDIEIGKMGVQCMLGNSLIVGSIVENIT